MDHEPVYQCFSFQSHTGEGMIQARLYRSVVSTGHPGPADRRESFPLIQIFHGMAEHMDRYDSFCQYLAKQGNAVCIHDQAGHGRTASDASHLGYFGPEDGAERILDDVQEAADQARELLRQDESPLTCEGWILFGHSMGSFIARLFCSRPDTKLTGTIFSGTAGPNPAFGLGLFLARISLRLHGPLYHDPFLGNLVSAGNLKRLKASRTPFDWLTRDEKIVDAYCADPWCGFLFTTAGYRDLFTWMVRMSRPNWAGSLPADLKILLVSGEEDPIGSYGKGPRIVRKNLLACGHQAQLRLYAGGRHEMINEINRCEVWQDLADWIGRLAAAPDAAGRGRTR